MINEGPLSAGYRMGESKRRSSDRNESGAAGIPALSQFNQATYIVPAVTHPHAANFGAAEAG